MKILNKIKTAVTEEITYGAGNLLSVFEKLDVDGHKHLTNDSLFRGLKKMNIKITSEEVDMFIDSIDDNQDGKLSYMEFAKNMSDCDAGKTIDDEQHHLFPLFESIRRKAAQERKPLSQLFRVKKDYNSK